MNEFINNPIIEDDNSKMWSSVLLQCIQEALNASNPVAARQICESHLQTMPNDPDAYRYLSQIHAILSEFDQARHVANRALELAPQDPRTWSDLGRVHILAGNLPAGITCYEETVADLGGQARRLMKFLEVPWDAQCLNFHQIDRAVQTPSRWQVRQPIYTHSVGRWQQYREYLPALEAVFDK